MLRLIILAVSCSCILLTVLWTAAAFEAVDVPRVSASDFSSIPDHPILIAGVASAAKCEQICDTIAENAAEKLVTLQRQRSNGETDLGQVPLLQAVSILSQSSRSNDAYFVFEEGFLEKNVAETHKRVRKIQDRSFGIAGTDWFRDESFPNWAKSTDCLVLAGDGATSTFHRDPLEWTGTSLCLEGQKLWRFVEPPFGNVRAVDNLLKSYRVPSTAWNEDVVLSAGWQTDAFSLYRRRKRRKQSSISYKIKFNANHYDDIVPDKALSNLNIWQVEQRVGDLLVIPAHWWHQTLGLEPSLAVASQKCFDRDIKNVLQHMTDTTGLNVDIKLSQEMLLHGSYHQRKDAVEEFFRDIETALSSEGARTSSGAGA